MMMMIEKKQWEIKHCNKTHTHDMTQKRAKA